MSIPVLYDACVLYGNEVRDLLIRIAISGMARAHWTGEILDETFGNLIEGLKLPDPGDRHVLAAAITAGAAVIVTSNLNDFPAEALEPLGIEARTPDDFVLDQIGLDEGTVRDCVHQIARGRTRPPKDRGQRPGRHLSAPACSAPAPGSVRLEVAQDREHAAVVVGV
jgi:hypothetical protein